MGGGVVGCAEAEGLVEDDGGHAGFGGAGDLEGFGGGEEPAGVLVGVEAGGGTGDVVGDDGVGAFAGELGAAAGDGVLGLGGEADDEGVGGSALGDLVEDVLGGLEGEGAGAFAAELLWGGVGDAVVADGGGHDDDGRFGQAREDGGAHLVGGGDGDELAGGGRGKRGGGGDEEDAGSAARGLGGEGVAHLAGGAVADEADGVDGLAGSSGGDEDGLAGEVWRGGEGFGDGGYDGGFFGEAASADHAAGEVAGAGLDDADAALAESLEVGLRGWVLQHDDVHGGRDDDGRGGGEVHRREEVVSDAVGEFGEDVGRGGRDDEGGRGLGLPYVLDAAVLGAGHLAGALRSGVFAPERGDDLVAGDGGEGEGADELLGGARHDDVGVEAGVLELADDLDGLVGGDASGDGDGDFESFVLLLAHGGSHLCIRLLDGNQAEFDSFDEDSVTGSICEGGRREREEAKP